MHRNWQTDANAHFLAATLSMARWQCGSRLVRILCFGSSCSIIMLVCRSLPDWPRLSAYFPNSASRTEQTPWKWWAAGAVGLNASTSHDSTRYIASLPSNVLELWFALESERFQVRSIGGNKSRNLLLALQQVHSRSWSFTAGLQDPVFRELYSEKRVVLEERRARVDNSPLGKFQEEFNRRAFANAYGRPVIGFQDDIEAFGRREVDAFFRRYYGPQNLTVAIVGDVMPDQAS